jgi:hypothetical protein
MTEIEKPKTSQITQDETKTSVIETGDLLQEPPAPQTEIAVPQTGVIPVAPQRVEAPAASKSERRKEQKKQEKEGAVKRYQIAAETLERIRMEEKVIQTDKFKTEHPEYEKISIAWGTVKESDCLSVATRIARIDQYGQDERCQKQLGIPEVQGFYFSYRARFTTVSGSYIGALNLQQDLKQQLLVKGIPDEKKEELKTALRASLKVSALLKEEMGLVENGIRHYLFGDKISEKAEAYLQAHGGYTRRVSLKEKMKGFHSYTDRLQADMQYRPRTAQLWRTLTEVQKTAALAYTEDSNPLNMPLRRVNWLDKYKPYPPTSSTREILENEEVSHRPQKAIVMVEALTEVIEQTSLPEDMVLHRGAGTKGLASLLGLDEKVLLEAPEDVLNGAMVGVRMTDPAFTSTAVSEGAGFGGNVRIRILAPQGTKGLYCEPFSAFGGTTVKNGNYKGKPPGIPKVNLWDGEQAPGVPGIGGVGVEAEILLQRNTTFVIESMSVTKEVIRGTEERRFDVVMRVLGQNPQPIV